MFDRELLNSYKFSLLETANTDAKNTIINMTGVNVMIVMFVWISEIYIDENNIDLNNTLSLKKEFQQIEIIKKH